MTDGKETNASPPAPGDEKEANTTDADGKKKEEEKKEEPELSEEDQKKKEELELMVERIQDLDPGIQSNALEMLKAEVKASTGSMTSVPRPIKFVGPFYEKLKDFFETMPEGENKLAFANLLSYLGTVKGKEGERECLKFKLLGTLVGLEEWGHEYTRHLCAEIGEAYNEIESDEAGEKDIAELMKVVDVILPFLFERNLEPEACDLLIEIEKTDMLPKFADETNYNRICTYMLSCASFVAEPEDNEYRQVCCDIFKAVNKPCDAIRVAMAMKQIELVKEIFEACEDDLQKKQLAYMIAEQHIFFETDDEDLDEIIGNCKLSDMFLHLARDLDVLEAKTPDDVYKNDTDGRSTAVDSARQNLASTFVNAFVNAGYGQDKLLSADGANKWFYRNKEHGMMSAAASLGMIHLWDVNTGLNSIVNYTNSTEDYIKAGALMGIGIVSAGIVSESNPVIALINEQLEKDSVPAIVKTGGVVGLGIAYVGTADEDVAEPLMAIVEDTEASIDIVSLACISLGMIYVGSENFEVAQSMLQVLMVRGEDSALKSSSLSRFIGLGLGLLFLGKQEAIEVIFDVVKGLPEPFGEQIAVTLEGCAYAGTGNVLKVQQFLHTCGEHVEKDEDGKEKTDKDMSHQMNAVISLALVGLGEEIGSEMALRSCDNLLQYGDLTVKRAVPLAYALLSTSHPEMTVTDQLSRLSHDPDEQVSQNAILALGIISAGTNNARISQILRQLATFYLKDPNHLFVVQIAQGLCHMGKGLLTLTPAFSDRMLHSNVALAGLLVVVQACTDIKNTLLGNHHYLLYYLSAAIKPNMLMTIDEEGNQVQASVRVGKAVDTVGQAGKPKTITGFQTHTTPVLIGYGERAELATDEYIPVSTTLEGVVILQTNPDSIDAKLKAEMASPKNSVKVTGGGSRSDLTW